MIIAKSELKFIIKKINDLPSHCLNKRINCNDLDDRFCDSDVLQIVPSTNPIFLFPSLGYVVKIISEKANAENELQARLVLDPYFHIIPANSIPFKDKSLIVMPFLSDSLMLSDLSKINFKLFSKEFVSLFGTFYSYIVNNIKTDYSSLKRVRFAGRSLNCLKDWLKELIAFNNDIKLFSVHAKKGYDFEKELKKALEAISISPKECCVFSGDFNLHNTLYSKGTIYLVDFEYWGVFDVDYLFSILLGSLLIHCDLIESETILYSKNSIVMIDYHIKKGFMSIIQGIKQISIFYGYEPNYSRVKAFVLARMYYRLIEIKHDTPTSNKTLSILSLILDTFAML